MKDGELLMKKNKTEWKEPKLSSKKSGMGYLLFGGLILFGILANRTFFENVIQELRNVSPWLLVFVCILGLLYKVFDGVGLYLLGKDYKKEFTCKEAVKIAYYGAFFRVSTLGSGMGISKIYYMNEQKIPVGDGMGICLLQTIFIRLAYLTWGILAICFCHPVQEYTREHLVMMVVGTIASVMVAIAFVFVAVQKKITQFLFEKIQSFLIKKQEKEKNSGKQTGRKIMTATQCLEYVEKAKHQVDLLQQAAEVILKNKKKVCKMFALSMLMQALWYMIPSCIAAKSQVSFLETFWIVALTSMLAGIIPMPSGFGSVEVIFSMLFRQIGSSVLAATSILIFRFMSTFVPFFVGAGLLMYRVRKRSS